MDFLIDALAVCRLSRLVREDHIFDRPRAALLLHERSKRWFPKFIRCPWCVSAHAGVVVFTFRWLAPKQWDLIAKALAASYVASLSAVHLEPHD